jgi:hypothetical protein
MVYGSDVLVHAKYMRSYIDGREVTHTVLPVFQSKRRVVVVMVLLRGWRRGGEAECQRRDKKNGEMHC